ncbi:MAG: hypothetical protein Kapaf2KO_21630 [Candidatus Kapaibacteriales bacterium]
MLSDNIFIDEIDNSNYPEMQAKFFNVDQNSERIVGSVNEYVMTEESEIRTILDIDCPPMPEPKPISSVLVVDLSGSMGFEKPRTINIDLAKMAANTWIDLFDENTSECALTTFTTDNSLNSDFTTDKELLRQRVADLKAFGGTSYNAALINPQFGALSVAERGKHKRSVIMLTDGTASDETRTQEIIIKAKADGTKVYVVCVDLSCPDDLQRIAEETGGDWYENVISENTIKGIYGMILIREMELEPCTIRWMSEKICEPEQMDIQLDYMPNGNYGGGSYLIQKDMIPSLEINPQFINFENPDLGQRNTIPVTLTARKQDIIVSDITVDNATFSFSETAFTLQEDVPYQIEAYYEPNDAGYIFAEMTIETDACTITKVVSGGYPDFSGKTKTIRVIHPNGGEKFRVGTDTVIQWQGVPPEKEVNISYSLDNGQTWKRLTENATGLEYKWENIPGPTTDDALIAVGYPQLDEEGKPIDDIPDINWSKTVGGSNYDELTKVLALPDGSVFVAGTTNSKDFDVPDSLGLYDFFWARLNPINGDVIWSKSRGGTLDDRIRDAAVDIDGNIVIVGSTSSDEFLDSKGKADIYFAKVDVTTGDIIFEERYGGREVDQGYNVFVTPENYIVISTSSSFDGESPRLVQGDPQIWVRKYDRATMVFTEGLAGDASATDLTLTGATIGSDGLLYMVANTRAGGSILRNVSGDSDVYILKYDLENHVQVDYDAFGGPLWDYVHDIIERDGTYYICGSTLSNGTQLNVRYTFHDGFIIAVESATGNLKWTKSYGTRSKDAIQTIEFDNNGDIVGVGNTIGIDGDIKTSRGLTDENAFYMKISPETGDIKWMGLFGGSGDDFLVSISALPNGEMALGGFSTSNDFDLSDANGDTDIWVMKMSVPKAFITQDTSDAVFSVIDIDLSIRDIDMGEVVLGQSKDKTEQGFIQNNSGYEAVINEVNFIGADAGSFEMVSGSFPLVLDGLDAFDTEFRFTPVRLGVHESLVQVIAGRDTIEAKIRGVGVPELIAVSADYLDFGRVVIGSQKAISDTVVLKNTSGAELIISDIEFVGPDKEHFVVAEPNQNQITLQAGEELDVSANFAPSFLGLTNGNIQLSIEGYPNSIFVQLLGIGVSLDTIKLGFGEVLINSTKTVRDTSIFENTLATEIYLSNFLDLGLDSDQFDVLQDPIGVLGMEEWLSLTASFTPTSEGKKRKVLEIQTLGGPDYIYVELTGTGVQPDVVIKARDAEGYIGQMVDMVFDVEVAAGSDADLSLIDYVNLDLSLNKTLFYFENGESIGEDPYDVIFKVRSELVDNDGNYTLSVPTKALLGNSETDEIDIVSAVCYGENGNDIDYFPLTDNGQYILMDACQEGGPRLIDANYIQAINGIFPNPATDNINVSLLLFEEGETYLEISDISGNIVLTVDIEASDEYSFVSTDIDVTGLANGIYFLKLVTPTYTETERFRIER